MSDDDSFFLTQSKITIIGLGLMGGSLALALKGKCAALYGLDPHHATLELACRQDIADNAEADPAKLLPEADLVILAVPVPAMLEWIHLLPRYIQRSCIVLDIGSTKRDIVTAMDSLPANFDPLGGHPICGREQLSLANAQADLYRGAPFVLTPLARTTSRARAAAMQVIETIGAHAIEMTANDHDRILASTSHLPFLLSSALALATPAESAPLIGPGFRSTARLAVTPASMMLGVIQSNRENVLESICRFRLSLDEIETALQTEDFNALESILNHSRLSYETIIAQTR